MNAENQVVGVNAAALEIHCSVRTLRCAMRFYKIKPDVWMAGRSGHHCVPLFFVNSLPDLAAKVLEWKLASGRRYRIPAN